MRQRLSLLFLAILGLVAILPIACAPKGVGDTGSTQSMTGGDTMGTGTGGQGGCSGFCTTGSAMGTLTITPPTAQITVVNGVAMPVNLTATEGGVPVSPTWQVDLSSVAAVDGTGIVTATGNVGGSVVVTAKLNGQSATAKIDVLLKVTQNLSMVTPSQITLLSNPSGQDSLTWAYPYDKTVFPKGILAQKMMWNGGNAGDVYRVHLTGKYIDYAFFTAADPPSRFTMDQNSWTQITESGPGGTVALEVDHLVPGQPSAKIVINHTWTIANGSMKGTVYYWSNNLGRVLRIKPGAAMPDDFLAAAGINTGPCTTCHAVSANGSTMIVGGDAIGSTFDLLNNTQVYDQGAGQPPTDPTAFAARRAWAMATISPDGSTLIENNAPLPGPPGGSDGLFNTQTGAHLTGLGLDGVLLDMPAFAPDGSKIAFVNHVSGPPFAAGALGVYDFNSMTHQVTNPVKLVDQGATPIAFPSVSPDAKSIVYHRGALDTRTGNGDLYLASVAQPGVEIRLAALDGDSYPFAAGARDQHYNYEPTFAPVNAGGYAWVVFTSRRTWGNELTGPAEDPNTPSTAVKQIWVAAIDQTVTAGVDPSHPAFRITGQDETSLNMRGFWALDPCKQAGTSCMNGSECCDMNCDMGTCTDPNPNGCSPNGSSCTKASDCCDTGAQCINSVCSPAPPQ